MKKSLILTCFAVLVSLFAVADMASATWYYVHGNNGQIGSESTGSAVLNRTASGLVVYPDDQNPTWIHFTVPTIGDATSGAQLVTLKFDIINALDSRVSKVRVYNGNVLVNAFTVSWNTAGFQSKTLNLGSIKTFNRGMGVSVEIVAGPDSGTDKIKFISVGANFVPKP